MVGDSIYVLTTDWIDDYSIIRQGVDTFEKEENAQKALLQFDEEVGTWVKENNPDWNREGDGKTFVEYGKEGNYFDSHAVGKITKCIVK